MDSQTASKIRKEWKYISEQLGYELSIMTSGEFVVRHRTGFFHTGVFSDPYLEQRAMQAAIEEFETDVS